jgi:hypothetical protein
VSIRPGRFGGTGDGIAAVLLEKRVKRREGGPSGNRLGVAVGEVYLSDEQLVAPLAQCSHGHESGAQRESGYLLHRLTNVGEDVEYRLPKTPGEEKHHPVATEEEGKKRGNR